MAANAASPIMQSSIELFPSIVGITAQTRTALNTLAQFAADQLADGFRQAGESGAQDMITAFRVASNRAQQDFQDAFDSVTFDTTQIRQQLQHISSQTQDALNHAFSGVQLPVNQIAAQAAQGVNHGLANIQLPANDISQQLQTAMNHGLANIQLPQNDISNQIQAAMNHGLNNINLPTAQISNQIQQAIQQGLASVQVPPNTVPAAPLQQQTQQPIQQGATAGITQGVTAAGPKMAGLIAGLGIGVAVGKSISDGLKIESGNAKMQAALGLSPEGAKRAAEISKKLYVGAYGESLEEVNEATTAAISSFGNLRNGAEQDMEAISRKALNMQAVFADTDMQRNIQVASSLIRTGFAKDGVEAMDQLSFAMSKVPSALRSDVVDALDEYSPFARSLGLTGAQSINLITKASEGGQYSIDKTFDSLKELGILATANDARAGDAYAALGMDMKTMSNRFLAGGETAGGALTELIDKLLAIEDPTEQATQSLALFGTPLEDLGVTQIKPFLESLKQVPNGMGDIAKAAADMDANLGGTASASIDKFRRSVEMTFGEAMIPLIHEMQPMLEQMSGWVTANQGEIQTWVRDIAGAFQATLVPAFQTIVPYVRDLLGFIVENKQAIMDWIPVIIHVAAAFAAFSVIGSIIGGIVGISTAVWGAATAFWGAATASTAFGLSMAPLILVGLAVFALGYAIGTAIYDMATDFDGFAGRIEQTVAFVGGLLLNLGILIVNGLSTMLNAIPSMINALIDEINPVLNSVGMGSVPRLATIPMIPLVPMATGGEVLGPTAILAGEKDPETIVNRGTMNELMEGVLNGTLGTGSDERPPIVVEVNIAAGVADDDETLANNVGTAVSAAIGANWIQKRA